MIAKPLPKELTTGKSHLSASTIKKEIPIARSCVTSESTGPLRQVSFVPREACTVDSGRKVSPAPDYCKDKVCDETAGFVNCSHERDHEN